MTDPAAPPSPSSAQDGGAGVAPRVPLPGSHRRSGPSAQVLGAVRADAPIDVLVVLRRRAQPEAAAFTRAPLTREQLAARYGADPADVALAREVLQAAGARVTHVDAATRLVRVRGTAQVLSGLFGTELVAVRSAGGRPGRRRSGELSVPARLAGSVLAVLGLDDRAQAVVRYCFAPAAAADAAYTPPQLADAYQLPAADGAGQRIAVIELGGGFGAEDLDAYFAGLGLATPSVTAVSVDGATNQPGQDPDGADGEVLLDIEVAGAIAPAAAQLVYFAPNTDAGFLSAVTQAAHASPAPTVMSISWGQSEDDWTAQARTAMDSAFADAALLGVTVFAAAGDNGSADRAGSGVHADFPASSPHVLGCGGTRLELATDGSIATETVWNDGASGGSTGGGISDAFALPDWQAAVGVPVRPGTSQAGRGVPDVAAVADPQTGYRVRVDGADTVVGGTSAVAPLWAALVCRLVQLTGTPLGLLAPRLYAGAGVDSTAPGFHDITSGSNGAYSADAGWDACTGLGTPAGAALLVLVQGAR